MATRRTLLAVVLICAGAQAQAAEESASYNVAFGGIRAGVIAFRAEEAGGRYTAHGSARASGLLGAIFDAEVDTVAQGAVSANTYRPSVAREVTAGSDNRTQREYRYNGAGVPTVTRTPAKAPSSHAAPASQQAGTVDSTTAAWAILRDRPEALACQLDITIYDGRRRQRIELNQAEATADGMTCTGRYTRVAGFSPKEMAEKTAWPLTMKYVRQPTGILRVEQLSFPTSFGRARITRR
ncbi:DUF3108 domain-containing protein [Meridianimarinicoccus aquatilis]|nr:DUF3108 domain-containing protein [Fluviibacterium aquatile]QIE40524.1 DUF3108 domain-containing protein [Rhodobacteraceae bacterium SC52]